jgi:hypothetical protein
MNYVDGILKAIPDVSAKNVKRRLPYGALE